MRWLAGFILLAFVAAPGAVAKDTALKSYLTAVGKSFAAGKSSSIAKAFPEQGKISLKLSGIKTGAYRKPQAKSLLATWFKGIKPGACKLKTVKGLVGRFTFEFKIKKNGTTVKKTIQVSLRKKGESWLIVGILES
jgi:hypothetical protein